MMGVVTHQAPSAAKAAETLALMALYFVHATSGVSFAP
jgi:hypothetical protein